ncbi:hypothetical protein SNE40_017352 [Patella caerulea]|uniref:Uncharacterized protein n=1 Tax=Patella caerulea TaxID=87958 RepID=A0AAN8JAX9_PATCE
MVTQTECEACEPKPPNLHALPPDPGYISGYTSLYSPDEVNITSYMPSNDSQLPHVTNQSPQSEETMTSSPNQQEYLYSSELLEDNAKLTHCLDNQQLNINIEQCESNLYAVDMVNGNISSDYKEPNLTFGYTDQVTDQVYYDDNVNGNWNENILASNDNLSQDTSIDYIPSENLSQDSIPYIPSENLSQDSIAYIPLENLSQDSIAYIPLENLSQDSCIGDIPLENLSQDSSIGYIPLENLSQDSSMGNIPLDTFDNAEYMDTVSSVDSGKYLISVSDESETFSYRDISVVTDARDTPNDEPDLQETTSKLDIVTLLDMTALDLEPKIVHDNQEFMDPLIHSVPDISKFGALHHAGSMFLNDHKSSQPLLFPGFGDKDLISDGTSQDHELIKKICNSEDIIPSNKYMRSLLAIGIALAFMNIAIGSVRNLQSSINHEGGVGMISLISSNVMFMIVSVFSSVIVQHVQPKKCFLYSLIPQLLYIICNMYPNIWLMGITSGLQGFSLAILWNAMSTYVTCLARGHSVKHQEDFDLVSSKYFGIICFFWQASMIFGNLIASVVLMTSKDSTTGDGIVPINASNLTYPYSVNNLTNTSSSCHLHMCGSSHCHYYEMPTAETPVTDLTKYILFSVYGVFVIIAVVVTAFWLEPLNKDIVCRSVLSFKIVDTRLKAVFKFLITPQFLFLVPLFLYSSMEVGFATADMLKAFVTCPLGIHMVGYTMVCLGVCASIGSYLTGALNKLVGRTAILCFASVVNLGLLLFMALWKPDPAQLYVYFLLMGGWGLADGIWLSQTTALVGVLFPDNYEEGYTGLRIVQGLGITISFSYAQGFCMMTKIYILAVACVVAMLGYFLSEFYRTRYIPRIKNLDIDIV